METWICKTCSVSTIGADALYNFILTSRIENRPQFQRIITDELPVTPVSVQYGNERLPSVDSTISAPATVIRWVTPPSQAHTPRAGQTLRNDTTANDINITNQPYAQRVEQAPKNDLTIHNTTREPHTTQNEETLNNDITHDTTTRTDGTNEAVYASETPLIVRFDEEQIMSDAAQASMRDRMEGASFESSTPTPIDDTPYIRFAIDQLTRDLEPSESTENSAASSDTYPVERVIPDLGLGYLAENRHTREELALARKHRSSPDSGRLFRFNATRPLSDHPEPAFNPLQHFPQQYNLPSSSEIFIPIKSPRTLRYPDLTFLPTILRPFSMLTLCFLCLLMNAAIIACAVYSTSHQGIVAWSTTIYGGRYFVFGFLPQILAACIMIYVQCVIAATTRIMPFVMMAAGDSDARINARSINIYPSCLLLPRWDGFMPNILFWLIIFTIPLQSCLFSVIPVGIEWRWTAVQAVAWTLVAIYFLIIVATVWTGLLLRRNTSGLMWDPKSLADLITLLPQSNCLRDYTGTDILATKKEILSKLGDRSDRLGYWTTKYRTGQMFYCIGEEGSTTRRYTLEFGKIQEKSTQIHSHDVERAADLYSRAIRFRHISWYLRDTFVILWAVTAFFLLLALFVLSFLPSTAISKGFAPLVPILPDTQGFSASNFLYSFIPSLLGMILYLIFQPLDMALRILTPWAELSKPQGQSATKSLLLSYTADLPVICTINAIVHKHYRIAFTSILSFLFILLPILAGGVFFPLTTPANEVRMIPSLPAFYIILSLLILYLFGLLALLPHRRQLHLPHGVSCLAEIFPFLHNSPILSDATFNSLRSKSDLITRLLTLNAAGREKKFAFGIHRGRNGKECLGVERLGRRGQDVLILE